MLSKPAARRSHVPEFESSARPSPAPRAAPRTVSPGRAAVRLRGPVRRLRPIAWFKAWLRAHRRDLATCAISAVFHAALALLLWMIVLDRDRHAAIDTMILASDRQVEDLPELNAIEPPERIQDDALKAIPQDTTAQVLSELVAPVDAQFDDPELAMRPDVRNAPGPAVPNLSDHFGGRASAATRLALVEQFGGNAASEQAVLWGLEWLARHQSKDGSWSFQHVTDSQCEHSCTMPGALANCRMGATSL
ncbi:MAG TPA: hypothetical protein VML55_11050, partial [Planctomycetaceae bacterium]|nr:hypothetical protein [Planctomycetaceae bacterium]